MAQTILDEILGGLWDSYLSWYADRIFEGASLQNIGQLIIAVIVVYVILMLLSAVFPFIGRVLNIIFLPFTVVHTWMHVRAMQQIKTQEDPSQPGPYKGSAIMGSSLGIGMMREEWSSVRLVTDNPRTARKVAFAPTKIFLPLFFLIIISSPFLRLFIPDHRLSVLIHMYLLIGCLRGLPNAEDQYFAYYSIMMNATFSPWYVIYLLPLFVLITALQYAAGVDGVTALMMGVAYSYVYFILFLLLATRYTLKYEEPDPSYADDPYSKHPTPFEELENLSEEDFLILGYE
ncbi:MAG: hypothetical protein ACE5OZ_21915 [Candidatus Heimdallarchaeota archaeon]